MSARWAGSGRLGDVTEPAPPTEADATALEVVGAGSPPSDAPEAVGAEPSLRLSPDADPETLTAFAHKARKVAWVGAALILVVFAAVAFTLRGNTESGKSVFHLEDQIAMTLLGLLAAVGILWFTRPRVIANQDGVRVRNLLGWIDLPWEVITAVRFDRGSPWAMLDLADDDVVAVMAVQAADKAYAITTVRTLRKMLAAHRQPAVT